MTYFEAMTAAAFDVFAQRQLELAILEVGLGGRFDATNVAPARLSAVTSISLDHVEELGSTVSAVAGEKAGIFRSGRPALAGLSDPDALHVLREAARAIGADFHDVADECSLETAAPSVDEIRFSLRTPVREYALATPLPGRHQAANAVVAVRAAELLSPEVALSSPDAVASGLAGVRWPGRLERFAVAGRTVLLDGCHNPEGAVALRRFLRESGIGPETWLVFGAMADKDIEAISGLLFPGVAGVSARGPGQPAGGDPGGARAACRGGAAATRSRRRIWKPRCAG